MKRFVFAIFMILSMAVNSQAKDYSKNRELLQNLKAAIKIGQTVAVATADSFRMLSFLYNGKAVNVFLMRKEMN